MKGLALILFFVAAAQAASTGYEAEGTLAAQGKNPWFVHLRVAHHASGFLRTCAGSLIYPRWVLTSASCLKEARFVWVRYGVVDVYRPSLVTETAQVRIHPGWNERTGDNDVALVYLNRHVLNPANANIGTVHIAGANNKVPDSAQFCGFGQTNKYAPGERLSCSKLSLTAHGDGPIHARGKQGATTQFDLGAPLVHNGIQYGILVKPARAGSAGVFLNPAHYRHWIQEIGNIVLPEPEDDGIIEVAEVINPAEDAIDPADDVIAYDEGRKVQFVEY